MKELLLLMLLSVTIILGGIWLVEQPQVRTSRDELNSTLEEVDKTVFRAVPDKPVISPPRPPQPLLNKPLAKVTTNPQLKNSKTFGTIVKSKQKLNGKEFYRVPKH